MNTVQIPKEKRKPIAAELNILLAEYHLYYQKLRNFHWNIKGPHFFELHQQFEAQYADARVKIDAIAERVLTLGFRPLSNLSEYLETGSIPESGVTLGDHQMVGEVLEAHRILLLQMARAIEKAAGAGDEGTVDLIGGYIRELEKTSWMLQAWSYRTQNQPQEALA